MMDDKQSFSYLFGSNAPYIEELYENYLNEPKHFNKLYTDDFYFNINEDYDKVVKNVQKLESRTKIFRKQDFLNYYKEYYQF